jgi:hypothetical protein
MKKILIALLSFSAINANAADIYVNNSGQVGTYTTISAAITAAVAGDRIFVSPYGVYTENLTIAKSLTLTSAVANTRFSVVGSVTVTSAPNQDVIIIGGEFSSGIYGNTGSATLAVKGNLTISDCYSVSFTSDNYIKTKLLYSRTSGGGGASIHHGIIAGCDLESINVADGPNTSTGDTLFIIGNIINSGISWLNNDNFFLIANNYLKSGRIYISNTVYNASVNNIISNNTVIYPYCINCSTEGLISINTLSNKNNIHLLNNILQTNGQAPGIYVPAGGTGSVQGFYNYVAASTTGNNWSPIIGNTIITAASPVLTFDNFGKCTDIVGAVNAGSPALQYYDIDLTRNNRGTFGGPYSIDNYWNTANGRARIYDLKMPFEIWNGSTPSIKAEGTHIK